jgi:hypothetical protein
MESVDRGLGYTRSSPAIQRLTPNTRDPLRITISPYHPSPSTQILGGISGLGPCTGRKSISWPARCLAALWNQGAAREM